MDVRQATTDDIAGIRTVAKRSLSASYPFLSEGSIAEAVEQWYADDPLTETLTESGDIFLVATVNHEVIAFSQSAVLGKSNSIGEIRWLHVDPDYRGRGVGETLYERTEEVLTGQGVERVRGVVLAGNRSGVEFYERHGLELVDEREVTVGGETEPELVFETSSNRVGDSFAEVERHDFEGETVYVFADRGEHGSKGDFRPGYTDPDGEEMFGWYCGACGSFDNAMDTMGRIECNACGNVRKPTRWDASYL
jgi:ribosomal protein S18 acetylase RimI-like enzyme